MRVVMFVLSILLTTALLLGAVTLVVLTRPHASDGALVLAIFGASFLVYGPLTIGSVLAYWDPAVSDRSRRYLRRWLLVTIGVGILSAIAVVAFAVITSAPLWFVAVMVGGGAILTALAIVVGPIVRRREQRHRSPEPAWSPISRAEVQRKVMIIAVTFGVVLVVGLVVIFIADRVSRGRVGAGRDILFAVDFASLAGGLAAIIVAIPLNRRLRGLTDGDVARMRDLGRVVLRGKNVALDEGDEIAAVKYAAVASVTIPLQLTYLLLLYIGLGLNQIAILTGRHPSAFAIGYLIFIAVFLAYFVPLSVSRFRRARRYVAEHGGALVGEGAGVPAP